MEIDSVGADDNFFDLGGPSLLAAELSVALSRELGVDLCQAPSKNVG